MKNLDTYRKGLYLLLFVMMGFGATAQPPAANLDQTRNGPYTDPLSPVAWENGNVNASQAHMVEDYSNPYRVVMTNMPTNGTLITLEIEYDTRHSSKNAFDFLTGYNNLEPHEIWGHSSPEQILPLAGYPALSGLPEVHIPITQPGLLNGSAALGNYWNDFNSRKPGKDYMSLWGGNITGVSTPFEYLIEESLTNAITTTRVKISFKSTSSTVILSWGAHIAREQDWGTGNSAGGISGSPYHTSLETWNLNNLGNQDRSLQAAAVIPSFDCEFTVPSGACINTELTASKTLPLSALATYTWSIVNVSGANPSPTSGTGPEFVFNSGNSAGTFTVRLVASVPFSNSTITQTCEETVTVYSGSSCSITPVNDAPYCPSSTQTFTAPSGMSTYAWTITGNGSIQGAANLQTVTVIAGPLCDSTFTLYLDITDANNCASSCDESFMVNDTVPPVITGCPSVPIQLGCNPDLPDCDDALALISVTDNCSAETTCSAGSVASSGCVRTQIFTLTATDDCDNTTICYVTYTWTADTIAPQIAGVPADTIDLGCNPDLPDCDDALGLLTVTDACGSVTPVCSAGEIISDGCVRTQVFTVTATDACSNTSSALITYMWTEDTTPPLISGCPSAPIDLGCNPDLPDCDDALALITVTDACGVVIPSCEGGSIVSDGCTRTQVFTLTATDACLNTSTCEVTYTWTEDTTPPLISGCPSAPIDLGCNPVLPDCDDALALITVTDACGVVIPSCEAGSIVSDGCTRTQVFTLTATDACLNSSTCEVTYTWTEDTTPPLISGCPTAPIDLGCNPVLPDCDDALALITVTDACGVVIPSCEAGSIVSDGCTRTQVFTLTATDACLNTSTCEVNYTWTEDTTPPLISGCPAAPIDLGCNPVLPDCDDALALITVTDACGVIIPSCEAGSIVSDGCTRTQVFTLTATDSCLNSSTCEVTYSWTEDTTPPLITGYPTGPISLGCNPVLPDCDDALALITVTDACGVVTPECDAGPVVTNGCVKTQIFTISATDGCLNSSSIDITYTWTDNANPPVISGCPAEPIDLGCNPDLPVCDDALALITVAAECGPVIPTCEAGTITTDGCTRSQVFTLTATDGCLNTATCNVTYTWTEDTTTPLISGCPTAPIDLGCNPVLPDCDDALALITVTDACGVVIPSCEAGSIVSDGCTRTQVFTLTATDACLNTSTCEVTYTWTEDTTPPLISGCPTEPIDLGCNPVLPDCDDALALITVTEACGVVTPECNAGPVVTNGCVKTQIFTISATDGCLNSSSIDITYTWTDNANPPAISGCPAEPIDLGCNPDLPVCDDALALITVAAECGPVIPTCEAGTITSDGCTRSQVFTLTATDGCLNTATCSVTYTWTEDTIPPAFSGCPTDTIQLGINPSVPDCDDALALVTVTDQCGPVIPTCAAGEVISDGCFRIQTFTLTATDACLNTSTCEVIYKWTEDTTPPVFVNCPPDTIDLGCDPVPPACPGAIAIIGVSDGCGGLVSPVCTEGPIVQIGANFYQTFTITVTDEAQNTASCEITYTWTICGEEYCTYTMGFWGQTNGVACNGLNAPENLALLLTTPIVLGSPANNRSYTVGTGQVQCVTDILPASGPSIAFATNYTCPVKLKNTLFGQTLALQLNIRYDNVVMSLDLAGMELPSNGILIVAPSEECDPYGEITYRTIPLPVMDYLEDYYSLTIGGIYALANDALGNTWPATPHPSYGDVTIAVSAINEAFDKCGTMTTAPAVTNPSGTTLTETTSESDLDVQVVPNPFAASTTITFTASDDFDKVTADVYNMIGQRVASLYNGVAEKGRSQVLIFTPRANDQEGLYHLVFRTPSGITVKKMVLAR